MGGGGGSWKGVINYQKMSSIIIYYYLFIIIWMTAKSKCEKFLFVCLSVCLFFNLKTVR